MLIARVKSGCFAEDPETTSEECFGVMMIQRLNMNSNARVYGALLKLELFGAKNKKNLVAS